MKNIYYISMQHKLILHIDIGTLKIDTINFKRSDYEQKNNIHILWTR